MNKAWPQYARHYKKAAELLESTGWCQHSIARTASGTACSEHSESAASRCLLGCISRVAGGTSEGYHLSDAAIKAFGFFLAAEFPDFADGQQRISCVTWNDVPGRTKEEVLTVLRKAGNHEQATGN